MTPASEPQDDDVLAAEYALHLLSPAERAAFETRLDSDGRLRARVVFWADHFAALADDLPEVAPPQGMRGALARAVGAQSSPRRAALSPWRWLAGAGAALALGLAVVVQLPNVQMPTAFTPDFFADFTALEGALVLNVAYSLESGELVVERTAGAAPAGRVLQLWAITADQPDPVSLGVLPDDPVARLSVPDPLRADLPGATLAISEEPPGGSPFPGPSGTVLGAVPLTDT